MKKTLQTNIAMIRMTLDCVRPTRFSVIHNIHRNVGLKCFFHLPKCLLLSLYMYISLIFHKVVYKRIYGVVGHIIIK